MKSKKELVPVEVFSGIIREAEMVKDFLENSGIEAFFKEELIGVFVPFFITGLGFCESSRFKPGL